FGMGELQEARFPAKELDAEDTGFGHQRIKPNQRQGLGHSHDDAEEVYFVVAGSGRVRLDDEEVDLEKEDFLRVAPEVKRRFEAGSDGMELVVFGTRHEGDGDMDPSFWAPDDQ
ncbi:MAG: cupin domain-containing protein, partial [Actinomycetota bacterium]|nr:cupin domain-containing protein [Actinomycetota bacterium]